MDDPDYLDWLAIRVESAAKHFSDVPMTTSPRDSSSRQNLKRYSQEIMDESRRRLSLLRGRA